MVILSVKEKLDLRNPFNLMQLRIVIKGHVNTKLQQSKIKECQARCVRSKDSPLLFVSLLTQSVPTHLQDQLTCKLIIF